MDPVQAALIGLVLMAVFMMLGMPIAFSMLLTGGGLVLGVLLANALLPARKVL
mgnify:CR=1 FL=1